jgi:two-component system nitrogen regulation sensor histidine kinase NtrY
VRNAVLLQQSGQPEVKITSDVTADALPAQVDATMIGQALTNLIKNAGEATETLREKGAPEGYAPAIRVTGGQEASETGEPFALIRIEDNGIGLPEDRARLFEPYVTTREKGTGLGLPIVKKIIEEHGGTLALEDAPEFPGCSHRGAAAVIRLPLKPEIPRQDARDREREAHE